MKIEEIIDKAKFVNDRWLKTNPQKEDSNWVSACYFMSCVDAYKTYGDERCLDAAIQWCENNNWGTFYDEKYAQKAHALYLDVKECRGCYDKDEHLWYRDHKYFPENALSSNGEKIFWSRGNGWVYDGLIQTMEAIGKQSKYYAEYEKTFIEMTDAIMKCRGDDGFWRVVLHDAKEYPMPETSGILLFVQSIDWVFWIKCILKLLWKALMP